MVRAQAFVIAGFFAVMAFVAACGGDDGGEEEQMACTPGATLQCACPTGVVGVATCQPDGTPGICGGCPAGTAGTTAGTGVAGTGVAGTGVAGTGVAGTGVAGTGVAGTGAAGTGAAGTGAAGTGAGPGCTDPETCQMSPFGLKFCGTGPLPPFCDMASVNMPCGMSGGTCFDGATLGFSGFYVCIKACQ
jgi:hypothetical protein